MIIIQIKIKHNPKWPYIPDHPYRALIIRSSRSGKTNALLNLINNKPDNDKIYLYSKDLFEAKYQYLIIKLEKVGLKHCDDSKAFTKYSNDLQDVYNNIEKYILGKKRKVLIVFDDMITDMINNKKLNAIVTELFIRSRKLFLLHNHILEYLKNLDWTPHIFYYENSKQKRT